MPFFGSLPITLIMDSGIFLFHSEVKDALTANRPVLALESTILAHGMPYPQNIEFAREAEKTVRLYGVVPATFAILDGVVRVGLSEEEYNRICTEKKIEKVSARDIGWTISTKRSGATTVSATMHLAYNAGIKVFSTGGIGGVHRNVGLSGDISQDISALGSIPMIVVSAGAKAILDLSKTLEALETFSVPVIGFMTNEFPAFYSRTSGLKIEYSVETVDEIKKLYISHISAGLKTALLVANPVNKDKEIRSEVINNYIEQALADADLLGVSGKQVTPFLLSKIEKLSGGASLKTNIDLALNNVLLGAEIAKEIAKE